MEECTISCYHINGALVCLCAKSINTWCSNNRVFIKDYVITFVCISEECEEEKQKPLRANNKIYRHTIKKIVFFVL